MPYFFIFCFFLHAWIAKQPYGISHKIPHSPGEILRVNAKIVQSFKKFGIQ